MVSAIIEATTSTFTDLGTAILTFLREGFSTLFVSAEGGISDIGVFIFCMLGISLTIGMTRWITSLVRRKI